MKLGTESFDRVIPQIYSRHSKHQWHRNSAEHQEVIRQHDNIVSQLLESFVYFCLILQFELNRNRISRRMKFSLRESSHVCLFVTFNKQSLLTKRFPGFKSRWMTPAEWRNFNPKIDIEQLDTLSLSRNSIRTSENLIEKNFTMINGQRLLRNNDFM